MRSEDIKPPQDPEVGITKFSDKHLIEARKWVGVRLLDEEIPGICTMDENCLIVDSIFLLWLSKRVPSVNVQEYQPGFAKYLAEKYFPEPQPGDSIWVQGKFDVDNDGKIFLNTEPVMSAAAVLHELPTDLNK